jgi:phosphohistidine phosphatase
VPEEEGSDVELYLIRHAEATPLGEGGITEDAERPLTPKGEEQAKKLGAALRQKGLQPGVVVSSPLLRARQTAELLLQGLGEPAPSMRVSEDISPGGKRRRLSRFVKDLAADKVALVGHQPDLGEFAAWLIGSRKAQLDLAKAGVACVVCDGKPGKADGRLVWLVTPELLG